MSTLNEIISEIYGFIGDLAGELLLWEKATDSYTQNEIKNLSDLISITIKIKIIFIELFSDNLT